MIDFEALGLTKEDLQERLIETLADRMLKSKGWDSDGDEISLPSSLRSQLEALITKRMDRAVQAAFDATVPSTEARVRQIAADLVSERERVAELEAQLAEARRDGERLDLLESRYLCVSYLSMNSKWDVLTNEAHPAHRKHYQRKSLRAAIDAAAAAEEEEKK